MWQYLYPNQQENPDWFVSTNRNTLAQNINTEIENRGWHNPENIDIAARMNTTQVQQLNQEWQVDGLEEEEAQDERESDLIDEGGVGDIVERVLGVIFG